jgi:GNAT superfamily N-acetyltransferase
VPDARVEVVRVGADRIDECERLYAALWEHHGSITPEWGPLRPFADAWARRRKTYEDVVGEGGMLWFALVGDDVVGLALCEQEEGRSPTWRWPASFVAVIDLVVLPDARGTGAGGALMAAVEAEARERGVDALDLMSVAQNPAVGFYEKLGFRTDLVTMRKPLR